jgi:hypothetical protein
LKISSSVIAGAGISLMSKSTDVRIRVFYSGARAKLEPLTKIWVSPAKDAHLTPFGTSD